MKKINFETKEQKNKRELEEEIKKQKGKVIEANQEMNNLLIKCSCGNLFTEYKFKLVELLKKRIENYIYCKKCDKKYNIKDGYLKLNKWNLYLKHFSVEIAKRKQTCSNCDDKIAKGNKYIYIKAGNVKKRLCISCWDETNIKNLKFDLEENKMYCDNCKKEPKTINPKYTKTKFKTYCDNCIKECIKTHKEITIKGLCETIGVTRQTALKYYKEFGGSEGLLK
jgi:uncharacterized protein YbaR (Trm112 family)